MRVIEVFRNGKVSEVLEVTKEDILDLKDKLSYVSIAEIVTDKILPNCKDTDVVGIIVGDIGNILKDLNIDTEQEIVKNPDCWFVYNPKRHGYKPLEGPDAVFTFGEAIELLKLGYKMARFGWNGKNLFIFLVPGSTFKVSRPPLLGIYPEGTEITYQPHIDMKTAQGTVVPWLASQSDILAEDYIVIH